LFRGLAEAKLEPVLEELLPYYERDEARHVGLGVMYLPRLLKTLDRRAAAGVSVFQLRCIGLLMSAGLTMREDFRALGINPRNLAQHTVKLQGEIMAEMRAGGQTVRRRDSVRGLLNPGRGVGPRVLDFLHPPQGLDTRPVWHRTLLKMWTFGAHAADRALA
jgi:hypothetical protein